MRESNKNKFNKVNKRIFLFLIFKFASVVYIIERLYNLQIRQAEKFKKLAENNRINSMFIIPSRGIIYDRDNLVLVENVEQYQLIYRYTNIKINMTIWFEFLSTKFREKKKRKVIKRNKFNNKDFLQTIVKNDLWKR